MLTLFLSLCLSLLSLQVSSNTVNKITGQELNFPFLETGFSLIDDRNWLTISTESSHFEGNAVILISLPYLGGETYADGIPVASRLKDISYSAGKVTFSVKLFQPNDSYCSKEWYVPTYLSAPVQIGWMISNQGAYNLSGHQFIISTGDVNRTHQSLAGVGVTSDVFRFKFPSGCDPLYPEDVCAFSQSLPLTNLGAIATLQTLVYETFLILRTSNIRRQDITLILTPHDAAVADYYSFPEKETAGFMVFETGIFISCIEGLAFETARFTDVTSDKFQFSYHFDYLYTPGVFGHIVTQTSLTDMTQLRVFNGTTTSAWIITQEDQCYDEQLIHTAHETASALVIGEIKGKDTVCNVYYNSPIKYHTYRVDLIDLFGDGWINLLLAITTDGVTTTYGLDCASGFIVFNSTSEFVNFTMVKTGDLQAPWEAVWMIKLNGIVYSGGYTTILRIRDETILYSANLTNISAAVIEGCSECIGPDPVLAKAPGPPANAEAGKGLNGPGKGSEGPVDNKSPGGQGKGKGYDKGKKGPNGDLLVTLYDEDGDGWYDADGALVLTTSIVPTTVTYPKYYILTDDKSELITTGTSCDNQIEVCKEHLDDGEYIFRVAGINPDPDEVISWKFCNVEGKLGQELHFRMKRGVCIPGQFISAADYCSGLLSIMTLNGVLILDGSKAESLTNFDFKVIESRLASAFPHYSSIKVTGYELKNSDLLVAFEVESAVEEYGLDGTVNNNVLIVFNTILTNLETIFSSGTFVSLIHDSIRESSLGADDALFSVTSASLASFELTSVEFILKSNGQVVPQDSSSTYVGSNPYVANLPNQQVIKAESTFTISSTVAQVCASIVGFMVVALVATRGIRKALSSYETHLPLPSDSVHIDASTIHDKDEDVLPTFELGKKITTNSSYFKSSERV